MNKIDDAGVWEVFIPDLQSYQAYKYHFKNAKGVYVDKIDPYAFFSEVAPGTCSRLFDIENFQWHDEKFLKERFQFSNVDIKIKYSEEVTVKPIEKEWENLICYMIHKYPLMRPMILLKSTIEVNSKDILVKMKIKGADFLRGRKLDRELERVIYNLFGYKYKLDFIEVIDEKDELELAKKREFSKKQAIEKALEHMAIGEQIAEERTKKESGQKEPVQMSPEDKKNRYQFTPNDRTKIT